MIIIGSAQQHKAQILYINSLSACVRASVTTGRREKWREKDKTTVGWRAFEVLKPRSWEPNTEGLKPRSWEQSPETSRWGSVRRDNSAFLGPGTNRRAEFPVPSLWAKFRLGHSSAEQRLGIADVKNGVTGRVQSGLSVTELGNFCSREHPLREVISSHLSESFSSSTMSVWQAGQGGQAKRPGKF